MRFRLQVAYEGSSFKGFAVQPGLRTVAGELARAISTVVRHDVDITCAGRTDAGVHALGQVVHVDIASATDPVRLVRSVNAMLGPHIVVRSAEVAPDGFHARHSARSRLYRYQVHNSDVEDPLLAQSAWTVGGNLDLRSMATAADALIGEHDFRAFCRRVPGTSAADPINRRVIATRWTVAPAQYPQSQLFLFDIEAQSFCHQMVRSIVGMLVDIGKGRFRASDVHQALLSGERSHNADVAPPHGLCLVDVRFDPEE